jgi:hypothetical protein
MCTPTCVVAAIALLPGLASAGVTINNGITLPPMGWSALYGAPFGKVNETIVSCVFALESAQFAVHM